MKFLMNETQTTAIVAGELTSLCISRYYPEPPKHEIEGWLLVAMYGKGASQYIDRFDTEGEARERMFEVLRELGDVVNETNRLEAQLK